MGKIEIFCKSVGQKFQRAFDSALIVVSNSRENSGSKEQSFKREK